MFLGYLKSSQIKIEDSPRSLVKESRSLANEICVVLLNFLRSIMKDKKIVTAAEKTRVPGEKTAVSAGTWVGYLSLPKLRQLLYTNLRCIGYSQILFMNGFLAKSTS